MVGAIDMTTTYRAYNAVREGVRTANRCTWATDGECNELTAEANPGPPYYNWVAYQEGSGPTYFGEMHRYYGIGYYLQAPQYTIDNFSAYRLDDVTFDYNSNERNFAALLFEAQGANPRIYQARAPHLNITRVPGGRPQVTATYQVGGGNYQNNISYTVNGSPTLSWNGNRTGTVSFTLGAPSGVNACRISTNFNGQGSHNMSAIPCGSDATYDLNTAEVIFTVYANDGSSPLAANGSVGMELSGPGISGWLDLGGRQYSGGDDASLCPRVPGSLGSGGVGNNNNYIQFSANCSESVPGHNGYNTRLRFGQTYTLRFELENVSGGDLQWNFEDVEIYLPRIRSGSQSWEDCQAPLLKSQIQNEQGCAVGNSGSAGLVRFKDPQNVPNNYVGEADSFIPAPPFTDSVNPVTGINSANCAVVSANRGSSAICLDWFEMPSLAAVRSRTLPCNTSNHGNSIIDPSVPTFDPQLVEADCNAAGFSQYSPVSGSVEYTVRSESFPSIAPVSWTPTGCNDNNAPVPAAVRAYRHHAHDISPNGHGSDPVDIGTNVDPRNAGYSCPRYGNDYQLVTEVYDDTTTTAQFFSRQQFDYQVGCEANDWHDVVRSHASAAGLDSRAFFESFRTTSPSASSSSQGDPVTLAEVSEAVFNQYAASACNMLMLPGQPGAVVETAFGDCQNTNFTAPPTLCEQDGVVCEQQVAGFCGSSGAVTAQSALQQEAQNYFFTRLHGLYPEAQLGCTGDNCAQFGPPAGYDPTDPNGLAQWEGSIEVPLMSANLIEFFTGYQANLFGAGRVSFMLGTNDARTFEVEHVR